MSAHDWSSTDAPQEPRTTETALAMPSAGRILRLVFRALRLRCPECGGGSVLKSWRPGRPWGDVHTRCAVCNFRYERSDDRYFAGAMLVNLLTAELLFAVSFVTAIVLLWPDVPWDAMTYGGAAAMVLLPVLWYPVARVLWLAIDLVFRPATPEEFR
jgi:uncharacterized protein (DUF983 family)